MAAVCILVIDDDVVSREVIALLLKGEGYSVETAESGDAALSQLGAGVGPAPDIVLTDMQMPGTAGVELARRLRDVCGTATTLVAMSGNMPEESTRRAFDGFLRKPFTMGQLTAVMSGCAVMSAGAYENEGVLNEVVYAKFAASMRAVKLEQLYTVCLEDAERRVAEMRQAAANGDDTLYRREAHAMKGGCGMVGATELQNLATSMETQGLGDTNHMASLEEFTLACERLRRILVAHAKA